MITDIENAMFIYHYLFILQVGGYFLPFAVLGGIDLIALGVCALLLPHVEGMHQVSRMF